MRQVFILSLVVFQLCAGVFLSKTVDAGESEVEKVREINKWATDGNVDMVELNGVDHTITPDDVMNGLSDLNFYMENSEKCYKQELKPGYYSTKYYRSLCKGYMLYIDRRAGNNYLRFIFSVDTGKLEKCVVFSFSDYQKWHKDHNIVGIDRLVYDWIERELAHSS